MHFFLRHLSTNVEPPPFYSHPHHLPTRSRMASCQKVSKFEDPVSSFLVPGLFGPISVFAFVPDISCFGYSKLLFWSVSSGPFKIQFRFNILDHRNLGYTYMKWITLPNYKLSVTQHFKNTNIKSVMFILLQLEDM